MYAHKITVVAEPSKEIVVRLPADFPAGTAEVIVLSEARARTGADEPEAGARPDSTEARRALLQRLAERFPLEPGLGPVLLHEDPCAPLDDEAWPAELRP